MSVKNQTRRIYTNSDCGIIGFKKILVIKKTAKEIEIKGRKILRTIQKSIKTKIKYASCCFYVSYIYSLNIYIITIIYPTPTFLSVKNPDRYILYNYISDSTFRVLGKVIRIVATVEPLNTVALVSCLRFLGLLFNWPYLGPTINRKAASGGLTVLFIILYFDEFKLASLAKYYRINLYR